MTDDISYWVAIAPEMSNRNVEDRSGWNLPKELMELWLDNLKGPSCMIVMIYLLLP